MQIRQHVCFRPPEGRSIAKSKKKAKGDEVTDSSAIAEEVTETVNSLHAVMVHARQETSKAITHTGRSFSAKYQEQPRKEDGSFLRV